MSYGGKAGFQMDMLQLGLDYLYTEGNINHETGYYNEMGAFLGFRFDWFRLYAGFIFNAKVADDYEGAGLKAGTTFYALSNLALSLGYRKITYDEFEQDRVDFSSDYSAVAFLISTPFSLE